MTIFHYCKIVERRTAACKGSCEFETKKEKKEKKGKNKRKKEKGKKGKKANITNTKRKNKQTQTQKEQTHDDDDDDDAGLVPSFAQPSPFQNSIYKNFLTPDQPPHGRPYY